MLEREDFSPTRPHTLGERMEVFGYLICYRELGVVKCPLGRLRWQLSQRGSQV